MSDGLVDGRKIRLLNIIDDFNRQSLAMEVDTPLPSLWVIWVLEKLVEMHRKPTSIRLDNGLEFISYKLQQWCAENILPFTTYNLADPRRILILKKERQYEKEIIESLFVSFAS